MTAPRRPRKNTCPKGGHHEFTFATETDKFFSGKNAAYTHSFCGKCKMERPIPKRR